MSGDIVQQFSRLFDSNRAVIGTDSGGCVRIEPHTWRDQIRGHLEGGPAIGGYPLVQADYTNCLAGFEPGDWCVKWGCVDLDIKTDKKPSGDYTSEDECHIAAVNLQKTLKHLGVQSWIERTRSSGRHVWVFSEGWATARVMRSSLLTACSVAGVSTREVNPKQTQLSEGQVGSYVRLPYPGHLVDKLGYAHDPERQVMLNESGSSWYTLGSFVVQALGLRTPIWTLEHIASLYKEPVRQEIPLLRYVGEGAMILGRFNALARHLYDKPVDQISDRSMHIEAFVRASKDSGLTASETLTLADELAARCGKFEGRRDREDQLRRIVERAWT